MKMNSVVAFLRQIPYIRNWLLKETQGLYMYCTEARTIH